MTDFVMPPSATLDAEDVAVFAAITKRQKDLQARQAAVQEFLRTVVQSGEARLTELQATARELHADTQKLWVKCKTKYKLDLDRVNYETTEDGKTLAPTMVRL